MPVSSIQEILPKYRREAAANSYEHAAVLVFLLGAPWITNDDEKFLSNITESGAIYWQDVLDENWSRTEEALITAAASLFKSGGFEFSLGDVVARFDTEQTQLLLDMIVARKTGQLPEDFRAEEAV